MDSTLSLTYLAGGVVVPPVSLVLLALLGLWAMRRRRASGAALAGVSLLALLVLSLPVTAYSLMTRLEPPALASPAGAGAQAIVVLGGGVARGAVEWGGDTVGVFTLQRVRYGAWLARRTALPVLVTGSAAVDGRPGEAALMRDVIEREFGADVRWLDEHARHTAGNAREAAALLRAAGIDRVLLVTHAFHMPRAAAAFERAGLRVVPAPTGYFGYRGSAFEWTHLVPSGDALRVSYLALRETAAGAMYRVVDRR